MIEKKYAVYNPLTGENLLFGSSEEALKKYVELSVEIAKPYFHEVQYMVVEIDGDTLAETWKRPDGTEGHDIAEAVRNTVDALIGENNESIG